MKLPTLTTAIALLILASTAGAQPSAPPAPPAAVSGPGAPPMPEGATEIRTLVERIAAESDREFVIDPRVAGAWGLTTSDVADYETLLGILRLNNLVAIETADQTLITSEMIARSLPTRMVQEDDRRVSDHEIVTRVINIPASTGARGGASSANDAPRSLQATQLVPVLRPMMPQSAMLGAVPNTNSLVLVDRYDNVRRITAIIEEVIEGLDAR